MQTVFAEVLTNTEKIEQTAKILENEFNELKSPDPNDDAIVIYGTRLNLVEKKLIEYAKNKYPSFAKIRPTFDTSVSLDEVMQTSKRVILIGGPSQNKISDELLKGSNLKEREHPSKDIFAIYEGKTNKGSKILIISDKRGTDNVARLGPERSPLSNFMSPAAVVAVASLLSVLLASLWARLSGPVRVVLAKVITGRRKKKVAVEPEAKRFSIGSFSMKYREVLAIFAGSIIYAAAVTLAVTGLGIPIFEVLKISVISSLVFFAVREIGRLLMCFFMDLHTEYLFWLPGSIFAIITGYLGNTLNTPGFVVEHKDKEILFNRYSAVKYFIVLGTFIISLALFILNVLFPSVRLQIFAVISSTYAATEILPFKPCPGKDIMKWKPILWGFSLLIILASYILFNFVI